MAPYCSRALRDTTFIAAALISIGTVMAAGYRSWLAPFRCSAPVFDCSAWSSATGALAGAPISIRRAGAAVIAAGAQRRCERTQFAAGWKT